MLQQIITPRHGARLAACLIIAILFIPAPMASAAEPITATALDGQVLRINPEAKLYLRAEAGSQSAGAFADQDGAVVLGLKGEWYLVRIAGRRILYMHQSDAAPTGRQAAKTQRQSAQAPEASDVPARRNAAPDGGYSLGAGGFMDALNMSVGPTLVFKPWEGLTLQASAGSGDYNTMEARAYLSSIITPGTRGYFGLCFLRVETAMDIYGIEVSASGSGAGVLMGFEQSISENASMYFDISYTPMDLEATATFGPLSIKGQSDYSPTRVGLGLVYYFLR